MPVTVFIEPLDTLFFRDHKPFNAGDDVFADSQMPSPLTAYGMIGSYILEATGARLASFAKADGVHPKLGVYDENLNNSGLRIKGPFLSYKDTLYFPSPANLYCSGIRPHIATPASLNGRKWDICGILGLRPLSLNLSANMSRPEQLGGYISVHELNMYLSGALKIIRTHKEENYFFVRETKHGHVLSGSTQTVEESYLYSAKHLRFEDRLDNKNYLKTKFEVWVSGTTDSIVTSDFNMKSLNFGGEGKRVGVSVRDWTDPFAAIKDAIIEQICKRKRFFLYLLTSAIFDNGWHSSWPVSDFSGAAMVGAAVNKPAFVSGWLRGGSRSGGGPRPLKRMAPAGSVYFFETEEWDITKCQEFYNKHNFNESLSEQYPAAGYGTALVGTW